MPKRTSKPDLSEPVGLNRVFKTSWFAKEARKAKIGDGELCRAINQVMQGQADNLGGGVYKKRLNDNMHRSIILAKAGRHWIYAYLWRFAMTTKAATAKPKSDAFAAIHSAAKGLHRAGAINKITMREYDDLCLDSITEFDANEIKRIREQAHVSQSVFARYLNTSESTVQKWETGQKKPSGMALRLLYVVEKHGLDVLV